MDVCPSPDIYRRTPIPARENKATTHSPISWQLQTYNITIHCDNVHISQWSYILFLEVLQRSIPYRFLAINILDSVAISHEVRRYPTMPTIMLAHKSEKCTPNRYIIFYRCAKMRRLINSQNNIRRYHNLQHYSISLCLCLHLTVDTTAKNI